MLAVTGQGNVGVCVSLSLGGDCVVVNRGLIGKAAPTGHDVDVSDPGLRGKGLHPVVQRFDCFRRHAEINVLDHVASVFILVNRNRFWDRRIKSVSLIHQNKRTFGKRRFRHCDSLPALRQSRIGEWRSCARLILLNTRICRACILTFLIV